MATRQNSIPVIFARGTNYEVGYTVGRAFKSMIHEYLDNCSELNQYLLPKYKTAEGKEIYDLTLELVQNVYPQYLEEIKGAADGSDAPFDKLFLLHLDSMLSNNVKGQKNGLDAGCSAILCNQPDQVFIGHNEDFYTAALNHCYILNADIEVVKGSERKCVERFSSFCYPGCLPGFSMGYNTHGIIFTINVVEPKVNPVGRMPRYFVTRALLAAKNLSEMEDILLESGGAGLGDGLSVNIGFWNPENSTAPTYLYNIEAGPGTASKKSEVDTLTINPGETILHCNRFQRLKIEDLNAGCWASSEHRDTRFAELPIPQDLCSVLNVLGDTSDKQYPFYRNAVPPDDILTAVTGVFDLLKGTWSLYVEYPKSGQPPVCVLPIMTKQEI